MKILLFNWNGVLNDVETELRLKGHTILNHDGKQSTIKNADVVVTWCEMENGGWREVVRTAQNLKKKVVLVQHGRRGISRIYPPFNEQLLSDVVCVWGQNDKDRIMQIGVPEDRIVITGTPIISNNIVLRVAHDGVNVVFAPDHWDGDITENFLVADELRKLKDVKIITKTISGVQEDHLYDNPVSSDRHAPGHMKIVQSVLSTADVVVSLSEGTFELLAQAMDIPVVCCNLWFPKSAGGDEKYKEYKKPYSDACVVTDLKHLNERVLAELGYPNRLSGSRRRIANLDGGLYIIDPITKIIDVIQKQ